MDVCHKQQYDLGPLKSQVLKLVLLTLMKLVRVPISNHFPTCQNLLENPYHIGLDHRIYHNPLQLSFLFISIFKPIINDMWRSPQLTYHM